MYFKIFLERLQRIIFIKYLAVPEPGTESEHPVNSGPLEVFSTNTHRRTPTEPTLQFSKPGALTLMDVA